MQALPRWVALVPLLLFLGTTPAEPAAAEPLPPAGARSIDSAPIAREVERLAQWVKTQGGRVGVALTEVGSGRILVGANETLALNPASNAKILTAAVALRRLGADYRYTTGIYGTIEQGRAPRLVLRGHGDPSLGVAALAELARTLVEMGLERVDGKILVDQSRFEPQHVPPAFSQQPNEWASFRAPISAVALERNTVTLHVLAAEPSKPARTWYEPPGFVDSAGRVETRKEGSGQAVAWTLEPAGQRLHAQLGGHLAEGLPRLRFTRRVDDPTLLAGYALRHLLESMGVVVGDGVAAGGQDETRRLVYHESPRLATLLEELGKESDNFYAEMIFRALGDANDGKPATSEAGAKVVLDWLKEIHATDAQTRITNGSGLYDANRVSAATLVRALDAAYREPRTSAEFVSQLAIGGIDGTLRWRLRDHRGDRRVRAKTGTLARSDALSGYVLGVDGRPPVAFSIIVNDLGNHPEVRQRTDRVVSAVVSSSSAQHDR